MSRTLVPVPKLNPVNHPACHGEKGRGRSVWSKLRKERNYLRLSSCHLLVLPLSRDLPTLMRVASP